MAVGGFGAHPAAPVLAGQPVHVVTAGPDGRITDENGRELHGQALVDHCRRVMITGQANGIVALFLRIGLLEVRLDALEAGLPERPVWPPSS